MGNLQTKQNQGLHVHTENIPQVVKTAIGKAFFEAYLSYESEQSKKKESEAAK